MTRNLVQVVALLVLATACAGGGSRADTDIPPTVTPSTTAPAPAEPLPTHAATQVRSPEVERIGPDTAGRVEILHTLEAHENGVAGLDISPDGRTLVTAGFDGKVRLWDVTSLDVIEEVDFSATSVTFSPDGTLLALPALSGSRTPVTLWDIANHEIRRTLSDGIYYVAFSPDGKLLASGSGRSVSLWDVESGNRLMSLGQHGDMVVAAAFSPDGRCQRRR